MKNIIILILSFFLLFSCTSYNGSKNINIQNAQLAHSKISNISNNLTYKEYKSLIIKYGKNYKFPELKNEN